jgi:CubicO group peptidase (beta-lactamase class C family)
MQYNNIHYWIIAEIVAHITKGSYTDFVKVNILDPVGLSSSTYNHTKAKETGQASESFFRDKQNLTQCANVWAEQDKLDRSCYGYPISTSWFTSGDGLFMAGPGGLVSSANDLVSCQHLHRWRLMDQVKWLKELLEPTVIPEHIIAETHKSFIPAFTQTSWDDAVGINTYGQGQMTYNYRGHEVV